MVASGQSPVAGLLEAVVMQELAGRRHSAGRLLRNFGVAEQIVDKVQVHAYKAFIHTAAVYGECI